MGLVTVLYVFIKVYLFLPQAASVLPTTIDRETLCNMLAHFFLLKKYKMFGKHFHSVLCMVTSEFVKYIFFIIHINAFF